MEQLETPQPDIALLGAEPPPNIGLDGTVYSASAWARFGDQEGGARVAIQAFDGSPLAIWVNEALERLEPCWRTERPDDLL